MLVERVGSDVRMHPEGPLFGTVRPPGSKSLTNRFLACTALAGGRSELREISLSDDAHAMIGGLRELGVDLDLDTTAQRVIVNGCSGAWPATDTEINVGNAGTAMRFLAALACLGHGRRTLDGSPRMRERPIGDLVEVLRHLGAPIGYDGVEGYPPIVIEAKGLRGGEVEFREPPSSQFLSGLMMAAPYAASDTYIAVRGALPSRPYLDMTLAVMRALGVEVLENEGRFVVPAWQRYQAGTYTVEPDASAATYFWAAAAVTGGRVRVDGLTRSSRQGDVHFVDVLGQMGCQVSEEAGGLVVSAPQGQRLRGIDVDLNAMPDTVQTLAVAALFADGPTTIRNVANLRIKETDRIAALAAELAKLGARVDPCPDGLTIHPPDRAKLARIATYDDHRMAMSFAIAGLAAEGITIADAGCVSKSHPNYFEALGQLRAHYPR